MQKRVNTYFTLFLSVIFIAGIYLYIFNYKDFDLLRWIQLIGFSKLLLALLIYLFAHFIRGVRLTVMMGSSDISLRTVIATQYLTNGINLIFPFKFGEIIRLYKFHKIIKRYKQSFSLLISEKLIDFCFLFSGLCATYYSFGESNQYIRFTIVLCGFITFILLLLIVILPSNIKALNLFLAKRYTDKYSLSVISVFSKASVIISAIKNIVSQKLTTIWLLTFFIWTFEVSAFLFLLSYLPSYKLIVLLAFLVFLSDFIPAGAMGLGGIQLAFYLIYLIYPGFAYIELSVIYQIFIFFPAILISCGIFAWQNLIKRKSQKQWMLSSSTAMEGPINFRIWVNKMASFFKI